MNTFSTFHKKYLSVLAAACLLTACNNSSPSTSSSADQAQPAVSASTAAASVDKPEAYTPATATSAFTQCNIESLDKAPFVAEPVDAALAQPHSLTGWVAQPGATKPTYFLRFDDKSQGRFFQQPLALSIKRADVVAAHGGDGVPVLSGFQQDIPADALPPGSYHVYLAAVDGNATSLCDNGREIVVR
jgi:hypothetical protein